MAPAEPWGITNFDPECETPALIWNGNVGVRIKPEGSREFYFSDNYEKTGEEKIRPFVAPKAGQIRIGDELLDPAKGKDFQQRLDFKLGSIEYFWRQNTADGGVVSVSGRCSFLSGYYNEQWILRPDHPCHIQIAALGTAKPTPGNQMTRTFALDAAGENVKVIEEVSRTGDPNTSTEWTWTGSVDPQSEPDFVFRRTVKTAPPQSNPPAVADIEIDGPTEDQQAIRSFIYYLSRSVSPEGQMSISPMGLSSDKYFGHVFWDADIWVFPALALIAPERAKSIPAYRLRHLPQAKNNYLQWVVKGKPVANGKFLGKPISESELAKMDLSPGAKFPWESSVSGKETVPGPSQFEDHISGSVAWSLDLASSLGLANSDQAKSVKSLVGQFYRQRSTKAAGGKFQIQDTMSPDENHVGDNDLYTNLLAQWCTGNPYHLPRDNQSLLTYDGDAMRGYKQAAAILSAYPLQYPEAEKQARTLMSRFESKVSKNGPAMSDSIHSIVWARLGETEKAYAAWKNSWQPFVKPPFLLFSEKRNSSRTYFTTGAAGALQAVLYGFAGIRIDNKKAQGAKWSIPLKNGKVLSITPHLPREWKSLKINGLTVLGKRYDVLIKGEQVTVGPSSNRPSVSVKTAPASLTD
ncbi:MAG TPA: glycosyl hydrolase family 65 protein [Fimbriimonadaceae bacterium]|nr:glycosyl hydrolase family 65 protein [Fimbriimonadaceae bacterium]